MINVFISHKIKTTYLVLHTFHSKKRNYIIIKKIVTYNIEFISIDKSTDKSILKMFCINKCVRAVPVA